MVIKELIIQNPFADNAGIVTGSRFVGRDYAIKHVHSRILGELYGNLAIVGLPRIGKSSLVWNALIPLKDSLATNRHFLSYISISSGDSSISFFKSLIFSTLEELALCAELEDVYSRLCGLYELIKGCENNRFEFCNNLKKFFRICNRHNCRITYILDEFDYSEQIFSVADFQFLRELSTIPETKICLITVSRRTIQELEPENGAISNFYGVFSNLYLQLFNEHDLHLYWQRLTNMGIAVSDAYKKEIHYFVGSHPFWLDLVNYHIFSGLKPNEDSAVEQLADVGTELRKTLWDSYDDIISLMDQEGLKSHFIQSIVGPILDLTQMSIERLSKYALINSIPARDKYGNYFQHLINERIAQENDLAYISISQHLNEYLKQKEVEFDIWALWNEAEHCVRNLISLHLGEKYGSDWRLSFVSSNPRKENDILRMEELRAKNKRTFGDLASDNLVNYTYPLDMWNTFISTDWTWFQRVLTGQQGLWRDKFMLMGKVRNPIAHSNRNFVSQDEQIRAKEICSELLEKINSWYAAK